MATFQPSAAPSNWSAERIKLDGNFDITNAMKLVFRSQNDSSQFLASAIGTVETIDYGTPTVEETAFLTYSAGTLTFVTAGRYIAFLKLQVARTSSPSTSTIATRTVYTPNGGAAQNGPPRLTELDDADTSLGLNNTAMLSVGAGDQFLGQFVKDSGNIGIELQAQVLATTGWGSSPSASIEIWKINENGSVGIAGM